MSTSALASARRRRAGGDTPPGTQISGRTTKIDPVESQQSSVQNQPLTPLIILQQHEAKIKQLEGLITKEEDYEELFQQIDEKIDKLFTVNFEVFNNELNSVKSSIEIMNSSNMGVNNFHSSPNMNVVIEDKIEDKIEGQNVKIDEFKTSQTQLFKIFTETNTKVVDLLTSNMESKIAIINNTTQQLDTKIGELTSHFENNTNNTNNISELTKFEKELNSLKTTVITNQSHILELSNSVNFLKDAFKIQKDMIDNINVAIESLSSNQSHRNSTHALFSSLMSTNLFGSKNMCCDAPNNMGYCREVEDSDITINYETTNDCELNLDMNINELILDENQIAELLEIKNFDTVDINNSNECELEDGIISVIETNNSVSSLNTHNKTSTVNSVEDSTSNRVEDITPNSVEDSTPNSVEDITPNSVEDSTPNNT